MERVADISKLVYRHKQGGQFRWVTVSVLLLAIGAILHLVSPSVAGVTPNWVIATYCVAIQLTRPTYKQAVGIGLVAALITLMTSKSAFPYGNLASEPIAALFCALLVHGQARFAFVGGKTLAIISGFFTTVLSGAIFVTLLFFIMHLPLTVYLFGMWPLVLVVALCNAVVTPLIYMPAHHFFEKQGFVADSKEEETSHANYDLKPASQALISVEHVTYYYGSSKSSAIKDVSLVVNKGDFLVITGPAGCGKSTICQAMVGAVPQFYGGQMQGMVFVEGQAVTQTTIPKLAMHVGFVPADYDSTLVTMTVEEEIAFAMENRGYDPARITSRIDQVLTQVGLKGLEKRTITGLSGGQRQRLAIGAVLATNPEILVLDEPTSSLDPAGTSELYELVGRLNKEEGITLVVVDHNLQAVLPYANRAILVMDGEIVKDASMLDTLTYMYEERLYTDALPSLFVGYMQLKAAGYAGQAPWICVADALEDIRGEVPTYVKG